jgi:flagellar basal body rod protein FlgC
MAEEYGKTVDEMMMLEELADWRMGMICSMIANANRNHKKKPTPFQPQDFMPKKEQPKKAMTDKEMLNELKRVTILMGGKVKI